MALRQGISLLLLFCLLAGLLPQGVMAHDGQEESKSATRAATDYISVAANLASPLVLNRRMDLRPTVATVRAMNANCIVVCQKPVGGIFYAIDPYKVSGNIMQSAKVDVHVAASESFPEGSLSNYPQYIKNLDTAVAEKLAMDFRYAGDPNGAPNEYLTDVGGDGNTTCSFAFRVYRSDGKEMQFSDGGVGIESANGTAAIGLKFASGKTERPTVRVYLRKRDASTQQMGAYTFQCNANSLNSTIKGNALEFVTNNGTPYSILAKTRSSYFLYEYFGEEVAYLYTAITEAAAYLQKVVSAEPNSANTQAFIAAFNSAVSTYKKYNVLPMPNGGDPRGDMVKAAEKLIAFYSFIDIPVEILDFRSDLFMMEFDNEYFSLVHDFTTKPAYFATPGGNLTLPGTIHTNSQGVPHYRTGLMESTLHNGYPMYKKEIVDFVAKLLYYKTNEADMYNYQDTKRLDKLTNYNVDWNKTFYNLLRNKNVPLGDLNSVLKKTSGGKFGDSLTWANTDKNSCYALAYYMLTNLWRPVTGEGSYAYNTKVSERSSLRLFRDISGAYAIDASQNISYNDYMGNVMPRVNRGLVTWQVPCFAPIDGLGYEKNGAETDLSPDALEGHKKTNYNFTMHAYGSFVYYKDQDLYFEFTGDDDVYFYVNNTMALDLGSAHTAANGRVNLNEKAGELGLVDGGVYPFDMFYAERRTAGSNLKFATNIKIVDTDTITTKGQYLDTQSGASMVNSATGKGPELIDYAPVNVGDTVAYSFNLRNTRDVPLKQLTFADSTLGVTASHAVLSLNSATKVTDLRLYYTTISNGTLNSSNPVVKTASQMKTLLNQANKLSSGFYGTLPAGCYRVNISSESMLKELLSLGVPVNCELSLYGFKRVVQSGDNPYINTVISECLTYDNKVITGTASRVITAFVAPKGKDTTLVLDYGKPIGITAAELKKSITIASGSSITVGNCVGLSTESAYSGQLLKARPSTITKYTGDYGAFSYSSSTITYTPNKLLEGTDSVFAVFNITGCSVTEGGKTVTYPYILLRLQTIPATMVYYEAESFTNVLSYTEKRTTVSNQAAPVTKLYKDWGQTGASDEIKTDGTAANDNQQAYKPVGADHPYGYDPSYGNDARLSNGKSLYMLGAGVIPANASDSDNYTQIKFSFLGTGFDLISRTNPSQGSIRVSVYSDEAMTKSNREKAITVNNYGELDLYQIPVVSIQDLPYRMHYVSVEVNDVVNLPSVHIYFGNQFYLDAIRIYDPIGVSGEILNEDQKIAYAAYCKDKEAHAAVKEIRESLLDGAKTEGLTALTAGAMFVDTKEFTDSANGGGNSTGSDIQISEHCAVSAATYEKAGPKNEVYLYPGQAIAFKLEFINGKIPDRIDVGAKTIMGDKATLAAGFVEAAKTDSSTLRNLTPIAENIVTSTAMYYTLDVSKLSANKDNYLVIYNAYNAGSYSAANPTNVLSITDLKLAYDSNPTAAVGIESTASEAYLFAVDGRTLEAAAVFMKACSETPILDRDAEIMHSLNLSGDLSINYVVSRTALEGCESFTMEVDIPVYEGDNKLGTKHISLLPVEKGPYYYFTLTGITAVQMNDEIEAVLHWNKDGRSYYSSTDVYSIAQYAYSQLSKADAIDGLHRLCADLLVYGSKAQLFKGYRLNALAASAMTEEQRTCCTDLDTVTFGNTNVVKKDLENPTITWVGKSLNLSSKVTLKFVFSTDNYSGDPADLNLRVSYTDLDGKLVTATVRELETYNAATGQYAFSFDGLLAAELRSVVSVQVYAGNEPVSCTLKYSADTYGNNKIDALGTVCRSLFAYCDSAKAYFQ